MEATVYNWVVYDTASLEGMLPCQFWVTGSVMRHTGALVSFDTLLQDDSLHILGKDERNFQSLP